MTRFLEEVLAGDGWFAWGTPLDAVLALHPGVQQLDPRWLHLPCPSVDGIESADSAVFAPCPDRPILSADYSLKAEVATASGLNEIRETLEERLGRGLHEDHRIPSGFPPQGGVRATSEWTVGGIVISVSAYGGVRTEKYGSTGGRLYVQGDEAVLAEPFVEEFRAVHSPWSRTPGQLVFQMDRGSSSGDEELDIAGERHAALYKPHLRRTPPWLRSQLAPGTIAVWRHGAGYWGIAMPQLTMAIAEGAPVKLTHIRARPARGSGYSVLDAPERGGIVSGARTDSLDEFVARIRDVEGVEMDLVEVDDA